MSRFVTSFISIRKYDNVTHLLIKTRCQRTDHLSGVLFTYTLESKSKNLIMRQTLGSLLK